VKNTTYDKVHTEAFQISLNYVPLALWFLRCSHVWGCLEGPRKSTAFCACEIIVRWKFNHKTKKCHSLHSKPDKHTTYPGHRNPVHCTKPRPSRPWAKPLVNLLYLTQTPVFFAALPAPPSTLPKPLLRVRFRPFDVLGQESPIVWCYWGHPSTKCSSPSPRFFPEQCVWASYVKRPPEPAPRWLFV